MTDYHFRLTTSEKTYQFDLKSEKTGTSTILIGKEQYSIIPENEKDFLVIQQILKSALSNDVTTMDDLSARLHCLPEIINVSMLQVEKASSVGTSVIFGREAEKTSVLSEHSKSTIEQQAHLVPIMIENVKKTKDFTGDIYLSTYESGLVLTSPKVVEKVDLASIGKLFTAVAAIELHRQGKLNFDLPISLYLGCNFALRSESAGCEARSFPPPDFVSVAGAPFST